MEARGDGGGPDPPWVPVPGMPIEEQAEIFGSIAMSSPDAVIASDLAGTIVWANPVAAVLFDRRREELVGRPLTAVLTEESHAEALAICERVVRGEHTATLLANGLRSNGDTFDLSATAAVRRDATGRAIGTSLLLRDVTEELQLQGELAEMLARSRARFDQSVHPQALLDLHGRFMEVNDAACELLGWPRQELVGRHSRELIHLTDPGLVQRQLTRLREGSMRAATYETTGLAKDGSEVPLLIDITAVRDPDGQAYEFAAFAQDLRDLREAERRLASQEAFYRGLHREASDVTLVTDTSGAMRYVTPSISRVLGYEPEEVIDSLTTSLIHADDLVGEEERRRRVREVPGAHERGTVRLHDADGRWRWFETTATNCVDDPDIAGIVINLREVTPEIEVQQALRASEARYRAIAETAQEGILAVSPEGDVLFANERLSEIVGLSMPEVYELSASGRFAPVEAAMAVRLLAGRRQAGPERSDVPYEHPDGSGRVLHISASPLTAADGSVLGSLAMVSDVTEQRAAEEALRRQALHDPLTGLPNRLLFVDRLTTAAARQERAGAGGVAVLFLDLDHFKAVNDSHGHETGDRLLIEVASRLEEAVRTTDTVARLGGDEFAVICEGTDPGTAARVASRIQQAFKEPVALDGQTLEVGVSIGVAQSPPHQTDALLRLADLAMYQAKATSRGSIVTYHEELSDSASRRLGTARALREMVDEGHVPLCYERIVDLVGGEVAGIGALLRWQHPTLGRPEAHEIARAAETAGLALALDAIVVRTALRELLELRGAGMGRSDMFVGVRLFAASEAAARCLAAVRDAVDRSGAPPSSLVVEVPEAALLRAGDQAGALVVGLDELGCRVVVTIGGGGSSGPGLDLVAGLPVRGLALDRTLVRRLAREPGAVAVARRLAEVARALGATASADGVEHVQEAELLRELGFALAEGRLWGSPARAEDLSALLEGSGH